MEKVALKSVEFVWSESNRIPDKKVVGTMRHANQILQHAAAVAPKPEDGGPGCAYHKTKVILTWVDGETYEARVDLQFKDLGKPNLLGTHVREFCEFSGGVRRPPHLSKESYEGYIKASAGYAEKTVEAYQADFAAFLAKYDLDEVPVAPEPKKGWRDEAEMYEALADGPIKMTPADCFEDMKAAIAEVQATCPEKPCVVLPHAPGNAQPRGFRGAKYESGLDVAEIAKRIRTDIKEAQLPGKCSVRIDRYAGGQSIRVEGRLPFPTRIADQDQVNSNRAQGLLCPWLTREAYEVQEKLERIAEAYRRDDSDPMVDYFNVNFYLTVAVEEMAKKEAA